MKKVIGIQGMTCGHCKSRVEKMVGALDGVDLVKVDLNNKEAIVELSGTVPDELIRQTVEDLGFEVMYI